MVGAMLLTQLAFDLCHSTGGCLGAGGSGGVAFVEAGVVLGLVVPDGVSIPVLVRPLLRYACQLRIIFDQQRIGGEGAFGITKCHGAGEFGIVDQATANTLSRPANAGDVAQALQRRQLGHVLHIQSPRQIATKTLEALQARDQRGGSQYAEAVSVKRLPVN